MDNSRDYLKVGSYGKILEIKISLDQDSYAPTRLLATSEIVSYSIKSFQGKIFFFFQMGFLDTNNLWVNISQFYSKIVQVVFYTVNIPL
jgi:hypothetical protein